MKHFEVIVCNRMITVQEVQKPLKTVDIRANVDGELWLYRVKKKIGRVLPPDWRSRGYQHVFYHAKNAGNHVEFVRVDVQKSTRKKKIHKNQMHLFN